MDASPRRRTRVKVCGVTRPSDAEWLAQLGVDAVGMIFAPSKRQVDVSVAAEIQAELPPWTTRVGVFVDPRRDDLLAAIESARLDVVQLHGTLAGDLDPLHLRRRLGSTKLVHARTFAPAVDPSTARAPGVDAILLDGPQAGSGRAFDWSTAAAWRGESFWMLAGGLHAGNVGEAIHLLAPPAVDVASGVESAPGIKDVGRTMAFLEAVRRADERAPTGGPETTHSD